MSQKRKGLSPRNVFMKKARNEGDSVHFHFA